MKGKEFIHNYLPFIGLVVVIVFFEIVTGGKLLSPRYISSLTNEVFTIMIGTCGLAFLLSQGCLDFSLTAVVAMIAAIAARSAGINEWLMFPVAILVGLGLGLLNGFIHAVLKVTSFIATLAVSFICTGLVTIVLNNASVSIPHHMTKLDSVTLRLITLAAIMIIGYLFFEKSKVGKECKIVGANPEFARQNGISVTWVKIRGFMIMGVMCAIVAIFALLRAGTASSSTGAGFTVNALNALLIGGMPITGGATSRFRSAILGSIIMAVLSFGMNLWGLGTLAQQVVQGFVFLFAISMTFDRQNATVIK